MPTSRPSDKTTGNGSTKTHPSGTPDIIAQLANVKAITSTAHLGLLGRWGNLGHYNE